LTQNHNKTKNERTRQKTAPPSHIHFPSLPTFVFVPPLACNHVLISQISSQKTLLSLLFPSLFFFFAPHHHFSKFPSFFFIVSQTRLIFYFSLLSVPIVNSETWQWEGSVSSAYDNAANWACWQGAGVVPCSTPPNTLNPSDLVLWIGCSQPNNITMPRTAVSPSLDAGPNTSPFVPPCPHITLSETTWTTVGAAIASVGIPDWTIHVQG